jgi:hypothetical protein
VVDKWVELVYHGFNFKENPMDISTAIQATFRHPKIDAIRKAIREEQPDWNWHRGGCYGVANALTLALGSKATKMGICVYDKGDWDLPWAVEHAIIKVGKDYYDWRGKLSITRIKKEYFRGKAKHDIKPHNAKGVWYAEDYYLSDHYALIAKIFKGYLTS